MKGIIARLEDSRIVRWIARTIIAVIMVIAAAALFAAATAQADDTIVQIEDGNLVYYQKTKVIPNVPKGIDAEQAQRLVEGVIPTVDFSSTEYKDAWGFPFITNVTHSTVSFGKEGWNMKNDTSEFVDLFSVAALLLYFLVVSLFSLGLFVVFCGSWEYFVCFFLAMVMYYIQVLYLGGEVKGTIDAILFMAITVASGGFLGLYFRRRRKKRQNAGHVSATARGHYNHA